MIRTMIAGVTMSLIPAGVAAQECNPVAIVTATLTDDGDDDGYADTRETVALRLRRTSCKLRAITPI